MTWAAILGAIGGVSGLLALGALAWRDGRRTGEATAAYQRMTDLLATHDAALRLYVHEQVEARLRVHSEECRAGRKDGG